MSPRRGPKSQLLVPSSAALGALLNALGPVLSLSWAHLGALLGHLGAILRPQEHIGSEKAKRQKTLIFLIFLKNFGPSGASLGDSVAAWGRLQAVVSPRVGILGAILSHPKAILSDIGSHLQLSGARLAPSLPKDAPETPKSCKNPREINGFSGGTFSVSPRRGPKSRLLVPSWAALGALLGALGPVLSLSGV